MMQLAVFRTTIVKILELIFVLVLCCDDDGYTKLKQDQDQQYSGIIIYQDYVINN